jgi:hypothetical protein
MALQLTNPYLSNLQGNYSSTPSTNQYGGGTSGIAKVTGTPNANIGTTKTTPVAAVPATTAKTTAASAQSAAAAQAAQVAAAQAAAAHAALMQQIQAGIQGIQSAGQTNVTDLANTYGTNNRNAVDQIADSQTAINQSRENTALNLRRGMATILNNVRTGFNQGRTQLAGMNATDSGGVFDLARAYAGQADSQSNDAHNAAYVENQQTDQQQTSLNRQRDETLSDFATYRQTEVDRISNDVYSQLHTLDANAAASGITGQVNYGIRDNLIDNAIAQLNAIDQQTTARLSGVTAENPDQVNAAAARLNAGGGVGFQSPYSAVV